MIKSLTLLRFKGSLLLALAGCFLLASANVRASAVDLGQAAGYAAFVLPGGSSIDLTIKGGAAVNGDVAVARGLHLDLGSGAKVGSTANTSQVVSGRIYLDPNGATVKLDGQNPASVSTRSLDQAVTDAIAANHFAAGLAATQSLGNLDVSGQYTITGNGGLNVISLNSVTLHGDGILTLQGSATDRFVFNITAGSYNQSSKSTVVLSGGLTPDNILWNFVGGGQGANVHSSGQAFGTFLSPDRTFSIDDSVLFGAAIAQGHLAVGSKGLIVTPVPEISSLLPLVALVLVVAGTKILRRRNMAAAAV